jgi:hypothetical protein
LVELDEAKALLDTAVASLPPIAAVVAAPPPPPNNEKDVVSCLLLMRAAAVNGLNTPGETAPPAAVFALVVGSTAVFLGVALAGGLTLTALAGVEPPKRNEVEDFPPGSDSTREVDRVTKLF